MTNIRRPKLLLTVIFAAALAVGGATVGQDLLHAATCVGATPCNACKNCSSCGHCAKRGGTCGVCRKATR